MTPCFGSDDERNEIKNFDNFFFKKLNFNGQNLNLKKCNGQKCTYVII